MGRFRNTDSLKGDDFMISEYQIPSTRDALEETPKTDVYLDPHHNMFVFAGDSTLNIFGGEIEFRAQVEKRISSEIIRLRSEDVAIHDESVVEIPIVNLVLNGDLDTLKTLTRAIDNGTPSVLIKGSKGVTDCLSYAVENTSETNNRHQHVSMDSNNEVIKGMLENTEIPFDTFTTFQQKCLQQPHLLSVVNLCNVVGKLEEAILDILKTLVLTDGFHFTVSLTSIVSYTI
ncbi:uncharacterized protein LOC127839148 [Dreissena polymorpha]|uniref:uncharacterized protein LOC127839148 n=1 Tax=Dreissena polymorpha TaxID=45954 RepID=UPI002263FA0B|nr:uncharacterized protein LOC127839148 [Dreissena polymorpha]